LDVLVRRVWRSRFYADNTAQCAAPFQLFSFSSKAYHLPMIGPTFGTMTTGGSMSSRNRRKMFAFNYELSSNTR
jgi:hypothetical protein